MGETDGGTVDTRGAIAKWLDWLLGVGWTKRLIRVCGYAKVLVMGIAAGSIALNVQTAVHFPWLASHWPAITSASLIIREIISMYQTNEQVKDAS